MTADDHARVAELLGRAPRGDFEVVVRDADGDPVVLRNAPLLDDGTPMPTRYWLVGTAEVRAVSRLEAAGGVRDAEAAVDPAELAAAHGRYAAERDAALGDDHTGPAPAGGVGGTRQGVKCLHAHYAWYLAGGDDPVGRWIAEQLDDLVGAPVAGETEPPASRGSDADLHVAVGTTALHVTVAGGQHVTLPVGTELLTTTELNDHDPPRPEQLTNVLGVVSDQLENAIGQAPSIGDARSAAFSGPAATALAHIEAGTTDLPLPAVVERDDIEEVFRIVATEPAADRADNPGLDGSHVDTIIATCCIVLAFARRLDLDRITVA